MEKDNINEGDNKMTSGHRVISPMLLLNNNKKDIEQLLNIISKKYNVSVNDAAFALSQTLRNLS